MTHRKSYTYISIALALCLGFTTAFARPPEPNVEKRDELYQKLDVLAETLHLVLLHYVEEVDTDDLVYGAIDGIMGRLDPHSGFMSPHVFGEEQVDMKGLQADGACAYDKAYRGHVPVVRCFHHVVKRFDSSATVLNLAVEDRDVYTSGPFKDDWKVRREK